MLIELWRRLVVRFIKSLLQKGDDYKHINAPAPVTNPRINILLLRGLSWLDDETFEVLGKKLAELESINQVWVSYNGFEDGHLDRPIYYTPEDMIMHSMENHVAAVDKYIRHILNERVGLPTSIVAYSFGGLVMANWLCRPNLLQDDISVINRLDKVCLLGSPLRPPYEHLDFEHPKTGKKITIPFGKYDRRSLFTRYSNNVINVIGADDKLAPEEWASLRADAIEANALDRLVEEVIPVNHLEIPKHERTVTLIYDSLC